MLFVGFVLCVLFVVCCFVCDVCTLCDRCVLLCVGVCRLLYAGCGLLVEHGCLSSVSCVLCLVSCWLFVVRCVVCCLLFVEWSLLCDVAC